eukprot:1629767-Pyramimonas_sp.AAC.1
MGVDPAPFKTKADLRAAIDMVNRTEEAKLENSRAREVEEAAIKEEAEIAAAIAKGKPPPKRLRPQVSEAANE